MVRVYGITHFYLPPTHEPYLPLHPSRKASTHCPLAGSGTYCAYPQGQVELTSVEGYVDYNRRFSLLTYTIVE